ncbi:putative FCP1 homology domain-containing protein [Trifolium medium]|uniref:Mitochondrial import inner membrane translocase subunit TIM50 n=1 Tax=Trifolium medium TaxID=97028 RepID=A0A392Q2P5_9FABA|nr:putative FCP1 homology domain-containing protein [Trifolium medium]
MVDLAEVTRNDTCCPGGVSEQKTTTTSSVVDIPVTQLEETNARLVDHAEVTRNDTCCPGDVSDLSLVSVNGGNSKISQCSVERTIISNSKNKLLILDVNGLLADCVSDVPNGYYQPEPHFWVRRRKVYKRPFCDSFLQFCFDKFHVGVWSSRAKYLLTCDWFYLIACVY